jgi:dTDP-4-dehydrorhamnose reductase
LFGSTSVAAKAVVEKVNNNVRHNIPIFTERFIKIPPFYSRKLANILIVIIRQENTKSFYILVNKRIFSKYYAKKVKIIIISSPSRVAW